LAVFRTDCFVTSTADRYSVIHPPPQPGFPASDPGQKKFISRLVAPTFFGNEPFGQNVEGLSYFRDKSYAVECAVQTHDFEDPTLCVVVGGKPLLAKRLRKFKHFGRQLGVFVV